MLQRSSSIFVRRGNVNTSVIARYFGTADNGDAYSSQKGNIFGDERDLIAKRLIRDGGSPSLVIENLKTIRKKFTHDPIPYSKDVPKHKEHLFVSMPNENPAKKVSVIGCGQVGLAATYAMLNQNLCGMIAIVDVNGNKLEGEVKDLQQGSVFLKNVVIEGSTDYDVTADSDLVIVTAGAAQKPGESRLNLLGRNVSIIRSVIAEVLKYSPKAPICVVANPCDIMAAIAAKIAGEGLAPGQIFGSGTSLDTGRFKKLIAASLNIDSRSVEGFVVGEHGDSSVPVWSSVRVGGIPAVEAGEKIPDVFDHIHKEVFQSAGDIIKKKGTTNWAIGNTCAHIADIVLNDLRLVLPVSTCVRGYAGVCNDVYLSVPCIVGSEGVHRVIELDFNDQESKLFRKSADIVWDVQKDIWDTI